MIQPFIAVVVVLGLLLAVLFILRKKGLVNFTVPQTGRAVRRIQVVERVALGPHHALHLVRTGDRFVVIATAPSSCLVLDPLSGWEVKE